jgi:hypothetical protein
VYDVLRPIPEMREELECSGAHEPDEVAAKNIPAAIVRTRTLKSQKKIQGD